MIFETLEEITFISFFVINFFIFFLYLFPVDYNTNMHEQRFFSYITFLIFVTE